MGPTPRFLWDLSLRIFLPACGHFLSMGPCFPEHFAPAHKWHFHTFQALCPFPFQALCLFPFQALCHFTFQAVCHFHLHSTYHAVSFPPGLVCFGPLKPSYSPNKNSGGVLLCRAALPLHFGGHILPPRKTATRATCLTTRRYLTSGCALSHASIAYPSSGFSYAFPSLPSHASLGAEPRNHVAHCEG